MCCGWTRSFWLLLNEVSANTVCMPTSPYPSSKLFFEVLHTNWEKIESLSVKNCRVALNFRYKTLPCAKEEQYDLFHDCIHSNAWSLVQVNRQEQAGSQGCPAAKPTTSLLPFPESRPGDRRKTQHIGFTRLRLMHRLQHLLSQSVLPEWKSLNKHNYLLLFNK